MLKNSKEFSKLKNKWKHSWKKELLDIFLFGSAVKGKINPNDIDICLIFRDDININIVKEAETLLGEKYHISSLCAKDFISDVHSLAKTMLLEGQSIITQKRLSESYGLSSKLLYSYDLSKEAPSKKVRFVYLLRGRNGTEGLVKNYSGEFVSNSAFLLPIDKDKEMQEVFDQWKVRYSRKRIMLMS